MGMAKGAVISEAMRLSEDDRLEIVWQLSQSVGAADGISAAWNDEIDHRLISVADGTAKFVPWEYQQRDQEVSKRFAQAIDSAVGRNPVHLIVGAPPQAFAALIEYKHPQ